MRQLRLGKLHKWVDSIRAHEGDPDFFIMLVFLVGSNRRNVFSISMLLLCLCAYPRMGFWLWNKKAVSLGEDH